MNKKIIFTLLFCFLFINQAHAKLNVVSTLEDFAAIAKVIGGENISVKNLARGDQDPHFLEARPSYAVALNNADLLLYAGLDLEVGWLPVLLTQSRNPKIQAGTPGNLDLSQDIRKLEVASGSVTRALGDVHPQGNPHYWLDPHNGLIIANAIADRLSEMDPSNAAAYKANQASFSQDLKSRIAGWEKKLGILRGEKVITHHKSFSYFMNWTGMEVAGYLEPKPGIPPTPGQIVSLIQIVKDQKIPLIIAENYYDPNPARELGKRTGTKVLILPVSVGGTSEVKTYPDLFDYLLSQIGGAL